MFRKLTICTLLLSAVACGDSPPPEPATPPSPQPAATTPPVSTEKTVAAEPTPEEKKKAEAKAKLDEEKSNWSKEHAAEVARWTPEMHTQAKTLADTKYPTGKAALTAAVASKTRLPGDAERDKYRHPVETMEFFGLKPTSSVLDIGPGSGWYTEILAPALAKQGKYSATTGNFEGPADSRSAFGAQRFRDFLATSPEAYGKVETVVVDGPPKLDKENAYDIVLIMRGVHGMVNSKSWDTWLDEINKSLKPNGVLGIEEHRAKADANVEDTAKKGYVPEKFVIESAEKHGFKLAGKAEINANAKDTKDYPDGVWDLPPSLEGKDNKDKYVAIGESDRMTLKFVKVPAKGASTAATPKTDAKKPAAKP